ncbi:hypothetical protein GHT09_012607 [Marmota monax]|uniref:Secreted protein n=1 Tax=Marmota monax TaxID=9995 RepID=A0A834PLS3_MARMO|nr:hypothetical protein GHT09_012607 [Marmota monax]
MSFGLLFCHRIPLLSSQDALHVSEPVCLLFSSCTLQLAGFCSGTLLSLASLWDRTPGSVSSGNNHQDKLWKQFFGKHRNESNV